MRALVVALALAAALAVPTATAASTKLTMDMAEGPFAGDAIIPVAVKLVMSDFTCYESTTFRIVLSANATEGVMTELEADAIVRPVEAHSYQPGTYEASTVVNLTLRSAVDGQIEITAAFVPDSGPCATPGGFQRATASLTRVVIGRTNVAPPPEPEPAPTPTPQPVPTPEPTPTLTPTTEPTPPSAPTPEPAPAPTQPTTIPAPPDKNKTRDLPGSQPGGCAPERSCGAIGDYDAATGGDGNETPGLGGPLLIGLLVAIGLARRRPGRVA